MLHLEDIKKVYKTEDFEQSALDGITVSFNKGEFVSILGPSGSGKTTMLNIIGGLDQYSEGDLRICGTSTKDFKSNDWDAYRNNSVGFVFQSYNLIGHISVLENVEMAMTLSGVNKKERQRKAMKALEQVGLKDHIHKHPNQLSGGQKQRVAIARALSNNPEIILADEPTGALDSHTSIEIMELLQEIASDKLVIMVTHNQKIAEQYSTRIVRLKDGQIEGDSPVMIEEEIMVNEEVIVKPKGFMERSLLKFGFERKEQETEVVMVKQTIQKAKNATSKLPNASYSSYNPKRTSMSLMTALKLSFNNLRTKFKRTMITSLAGSIGIIGVALVLFISNGMNYEIASLEEDQLAGMPITIIETPTVLNIGPPVNNSEDGTESINVNHIIPYDPETTTYTHKNLLTDDFIDYVDTMNPDYYDTIQYQMALNLNVLIKNNSGIIELVDTNTLTGGNQVFIGTTIFNELPDNNDLIIEQNEILSGRMSENMNEVILVIEDDNEIDQNLLQTIGITPHEIVYYDEVIGTEFSVALNDDYYTSLESPKDSEGSENQVLYAINNDMTTIYENGITLEIVGILRPVHEDDDAETNSALNLLSSGIYYTTDLTNRLIDESMNSEIVNAQIESEIDVLTGREFTEHYTQNEAIKKLGGSSVPTGIVIYSKYYEQKTNIKTYLDEWNTDLDEEDTIEYTDLSEQISGSMTSMIDLIEIVLVSFAAISLVVSSIMIGIITYVSVIERTKEIGVLRSLGASKRDIKTVFYAETAIVGCIAGLLGIAITGLLSIPISSILEGMLDISGIVQFSAYQSVILVVISTALTIFSGLIPASIAARKNPVEALRSE